MKYAMILGILISSAFSYQPNLCYYLTKYSTNDLIFLPQTQKLDSKSYTNDFTSYSTSTYKYENSQLKSFSTFNNVNTDTSIYNYTFSNNTYNSNYNIISINNNFIDSIYFPSSDQHVYRSITNDTLKNTVVLFYNKNIDTYYRQYQFFKNDTMFVKEEGYPTRDTLATPIVRNFTCIASSGKCGCTASFSSEDAKSKDSIFFANNTYTINKYVNDTLNNSSIYKLQQNVTNAINDTKNHIKIFNAYSPTGSIVLQNINLVDLQNFKTINPNQILLVK